MTGTDVATYTRERPGMSAFVLEDGGGAVGGGGLERERAHARPLRV